MDLNYSIMIDNNHFLDQFLHLMKLEYSMVKMMNRVHVGHSVHLINKESQTQATKTCLTTKVRLAVTNLDRIMSAEGTDCFFFYDECRDDAEPTDLTEDILKDCQSVGSAKLYGYKMYQQESASSWYTY